MKQIQSSSTNIKHKHSFRWGLNIAGKSGSLKSTKSDKSDGGSRSGEEAGSRGSSGRGMGAMMLANLHGLTRSWPDILNGSFRLFLAILGVQKMALTVPESKF